MSKKFLLIILTLILIFSISACEKETAGTNTPADSEETASAEMTIVEEAGMKNVFSETSTNLNFEVSFNREYTKYFDKMFIMDGRIYTAGDRVKKDPDINITTNLSMRSGDMESFFHEYCHLLSFDENGENMEIRKITQVNPDPMCDIRFMWYDSEYNQITIEDYNLTYTLHKRTFDDEIIFSMPLDDIFKEVSIRSMVIGEDDNIYISNNYQLLIISKDGEILKNITTRNFWESGGGYIYTVASAHGKKPIFTMYAYDGANVVYNYYDWETDDFIPIEMPLVDDPDNFGLVTKYGIIMYGEGYDYYYYNDAGIYGYDIAGNTLTKVMDWMNSDITANETNGILPISPERMARVYTEGGAYNRLYSILTRVPDDEIPEKTYLSIGYIAPKPPEYLTRAVSNFNANNDFFRITLTNYYNADSEADPAVRLNAAIAGGNAPDILFGNDYLPLLSYSNKDMLVDMNEFLNEYDGLRENLLPFVTKAAIRNKLTYMPTGFNVDTLIGKTANVGDKVNWTFTDMLEIYKSGKIITHDLSKNFLYTYSLDKIIADCVDYTAASCDFNKQGFKDFIELMKLLPDDYDVTQEYGPNYMQIHNDRYEAHRKDEILLASVFVFSLPEYVDPIVYNFRDAPTTAIGYPTISGDMRGDYVNTCGFSILNSSENIDVAWQFIMYCLSDHFAGFTLSNLYNVSTSSGIDTCNGKYFGLMTARVYDDFNNVGKDSNAFVDGVDGINITYSEWYDRFNDYIKYVENYVPKDNDIRKIIIDELSAYYGADKNIDDVIKVIQSRVSVYLSEMWG